MSTLKIFLSYSWANTDIANTLDEDFLNFGITLIRDIRDANYRSSLKSFMNNIKDADFVLMLISHEFLTSDNCMYEVLELLNAKEFEKKILPINIGNASFFKADGKVTYYDHWENQIQKTKQFLAKYTSTDFAEQLKHQNNIRNNLPEFFFRVTDLNMMRFDELRGVNYQPLLKIIGHSDRELIIALEDISELEDLESKEAAFEDLLNSFGQHFLIYFHRAVYNKREGRFKLAKTYYEKTLSLSPSFIGAYNNYALLLETSNEFDKAKSLYEIALKLYPKFESALLNYGNLLEHHYKDIIGARKIWEQALKVNPNNKKFHVNYAGLLTDHFKEYELAIQHYEFALKIDPQYELALSACASLLDMKLNDIVRATKIYNRLLALKPDDNMVYKVAEFFSKIDDKNQVTEILKITIEVNLTPELNFHYARLAELHSSNFKLADKFYKKAIKFSPENAGYHNYYGVFAEYKLLDIRLAKKYYLKALKLKPQHATYHYNIAYVLETHYNDFNQSKKHYEFAKRYDENYINAYINLADLLRREFPKEDYLKIIEDAVKINPEFKVIYNVLFSNAKTFLERRSRVIEIFEMAIKLAPSNAHIRHLYAETLSLDIRDGDLSQSQYELAINLSNNELKIIIDYIYFLVRFEKFEYAEKKLIEYIKLHENDLTLISSLSSILSYNKKYDLAIVYCLKAIDIDMDNSMLHYNYSNILKALNRNDESIIAYKSALALGLEEELKNYEIKTLS